MSKIENYNRLKNISNECNRIISKSRKGLVNFSRLTDEGYHTVAFSFITEGYNSHKYEKCKEMADYIGDACKEFKDKIMDRVLEIANQKAEEAKKAAKEEAESILMEINI